MPQPTPRKEHPLSMRLPDADIAIIDRAARLRGRSRTEFVRDAAVRARHCGRPGRARVTYMQHA